MTRRIALFWAVLCLAAAPVKAQRPAARRVILVLIDSLRADRLGCYGYSKPTSPHIDRLAGESAVFEAAVAQAPWTLPSVASLMTSLYPERHGVSFSSSHSAVGLPPADRTLAESFSEAGFETAAFVSPGFLSPRFGLGRGFKNYMVDPIASWSRSLHSARAWLESQGQGRAFLLLHTNDVHSPFHPPHTFVRRFDPGYEGVLDQLWLDDYFLRALNRLERGQGLAAAPEAYVRLVEQVRASERDLDHLRAHYDGSVAYADELLGAFLDQLKESGSWENTVLALISDHGEELGERGRFYHGLSLHEELVRIPWIMKGPGIAARRIAEPVEEIDVAPTLLELAGLEPPAGFQGRSLAGALKGDQPIPARAALSSRTDTRSRRVLEASVRSGAWKLILDPATGKKRLYDLSADPGERRDLAARHPGRLEQLLFERETRLGRNRGQKPVSRADLGQEEIKALRELGYLK